MISWLCRAQMAQNRPFRGPEPAQGTQRLPSDFSESDRSPLEPAQSAADRLLAQAMQQSFAAGLYLVATPIGNLADVTLRAIAVLARADLVYCEDTRITRRLLDACGISRRLETYHEHNAEAVRPKILEAIAEGKTVALLSDAGTPLISDPGYKLVRDVAEAGGVVTSLPGASALTVAASVSGLPTDMIVFLGFLPQKAQARAARLSAVAALPATLVIYEAPQRTAATLGHLAAQLGERPAAVMREMTKRHEEVRRGGLQDLADALAGETVKGEIVIAVGPAQETGVVDETEIIRRLETALAETKLADASRRVAKDLGVPRQRVYQLGLQLKSDGGDG